MGVHGVDVRLGLEDGLHHLEPGVGQEVGGLLGDDGDAVPAQLLDGVGETSRALLGDRDAGQALDLHHVALAVELLGQGELAEDADAVVVAPIQVR